MSIVKLKDDESRDCAYFISYFFGGKKEKTGKPGGTNIWTFTLLPALSPWCQAIFLEVEMNKYRHVYYCRGTAWLASLISMDWVFV